MRTARFRTTTRGVLLLLLVLLVSACTSAGTPQAAGPAPAAAPAQQQPRQGVAWPAGLPATDAVTCPAPTVEVNTPGQLQAALDAAVPGAVIGMADGVYDGTFSATTSGTAQAPIWLCGSKDAVLQGSGTDNGVVLHLRQVTQWRLVGFTVRDGQKGVMADQVTDSVIQDLTVTDIGDEAVHLRTASTANVVRGLTISDTGQRREKFGEGIYVGSAHSNWCEVSDCEPDRSDHNVVIANTISDTAAESIDIKEGTTGGVVADNTFDGAGMKGDADSWIDVKGNDWLIQANHGSTAVTSGFQVNDQADGWGTGNTFDANTADVQGPGYGYELRAPTDSPAAANRVTCTNTATGAQAGLTNTTCT
jgi:Right handed beta helix region